MLTVLRAFLIIAAPITALFVSRDALNFGVIETLVAVILIAAFCRRWRSGDCARPIDTANLRKRGLDRCSNYVRSSGTCPNRRSTCF